MKWQYLMVGLFLVACIGSVDAQVRENFQSWGSSSTSGGYINLYNPTTGQVTLYQPYAVDPSIFVNPHGAYTYAAVDVNNGQYMSNPKIWFFLYDSGYNVISTVGTEGGVPNGRVEMKIIGGTPTVFLNGVQYQTGIPVTVNPTYLVLSTQNSWNSYNLDNLVVGGTDHHVVGALPSNWTIQRDLINPAATGVYAWNNATQTWVSQNNQYFYIDADPDSQDGVSSENFDIVYYNTATIVNTTVIDSNVPRHQIQYNVADFLNTPYFSSTLPDGEYYAQFRGYPDSRAYFWVISSGAAVSWDQTTYAQGNAATITYAVSNSYWSPSTYTYRVDVIDTTGTVKKTQTINSQTGTVSIANLDSTTYPAGAYYAEVIAHDTSDHVMGYAAMEVTDYVYLSGGYVMNAETGAVLSNANVTVSQGSTTVSYTSAPGGWGNTSSYWLTGSYITAHTNLSGYTDDIQTFIPIGAGSFPWNISLIPSPASSTGISVGGIVRQGDSSGVTKPIPNPISAAIYHVKNGTEYTCTTNIAGYCRVNNLVNNTLYDVWSSKTGYANSTVEQKLAVGA